MIEDQIRLSMISLFVALCAVVSAARLSRQPLPGRYLLRATIGSLGVAVGVFVTTFVVSGFGWGWPDLSRSRELLLLVIGGLCIGLIQATFGRILSGRMPALFISSLVLANIAVLLIPSDYGIWRWAAFALANFLLLAIWLAKAVPREAVR